MVLTVPTNLFESEINGWMAGWLDGWMDEWMLHACIDASHACMADACEGSTTVHVTMAQIQGAYLSSNLMDAWSGL
jgi:hypothetical protein